MPEAGGRSGGGARRPSPVGWLPSGHHVCGAVQVPKAPWSVAWEFDPCAAPSGFGSQRVCASWATTKKTEEEDKEEEEEKEE